MVARGGGKNQNFRDTFWNSRRNLSKFLKKGDAHEWLKLNMFKPFRSHEGLHCFAFGLRA